MDLSTLALLVLGIFVLVLIFRAILSTVKFLILVGILLFLMASLYYGFDTVKAHLPLTGAAVVETGKIVASEIDRLEEDFDRLEEELDRLLPFPYGE